MAAGQDGAALARLGEAGDTGRRQLELVEVGEIDLDRYLGCQPEQGAAALTAILRHEAQDTILERGCALFRPARQRSRNDVGDVGAEDLPELRAVDRVGVAQQMAQERPRL